MKDFNNFHSAIRFRVVYSFVTENHQSGYQREVSSHKETIAEAIQETLCEVLEEKTPMVGISVYQCIFTA